MKKELVESIYNLIVERFGEPIGDNQGVPTSSKKKDMKNRGFGSKLTEKSEESLCQKCGMMPQSMDQSHFCMVDEVDEIDAFEGPKSSDMYWALADELISQHPDMNPQEMFELLTQNNIPENVAMDMIEEITGLPVNEKAPPGGENVVKALKKEKNVDNPWAVAWAMKNRGEI